MGFYPNKVMSCCVLCMFGERMYNQRVKNVSTHQIGNRARASKSVWDGGELLKFHPAVLTPHAAVVENLSRSAHELYIYGTI